MYLTLKLFDIVIMNYLSSSGAEWYNYNNPNDAANYCPDLQVNHVNDSNDDDEDTDDDDDNTDGVDDTDNL